MKRERLAWLAANPRYTRRFVLAVGRRCRTSTVKDVAAEMDLHWDTVKEIDKLYMQEQLALAGPPAPTAIGVDEISIGLYKAYLLKEQFGQLWDFDDPKEAALYFSEWRSGLRWQKLAPFEKFARMVGTHWDGIASYCATENKVPLGFVEGLNNRIRVLQRRAYGFRDEDYLRLKILTCQLPKL